MFLYGACIIYSYLCIQIVAILTENILRLHNMS